jgi:hypothetical protein
MRSERATEPVGGCLSETSGELGRRSAADPAKLQLADGS